MNNPKVLAVDLDGTLVKEDTYYKALFWLARHSVVQFIKALTLGIKGRNFSKIYVASVVNLQPSDLTYNLEVISLINKYKSNGAVVVLVSGAALTNVDKVAKYIGLFDGIIASDESINLTGKNKSEMLCSIYGKYMFRYVGNSSVDISVWEKSEKAYVVSDKNSLYCKLERCGTPYEVVRPSWNIIGKAR